MTQCSPDVIKRGILHEQEEVRLTALQYFSRSDCGDTTIMPLVIESVERHGRGSAFSILRDATGLQQTPATIDWLVSELQRAYNPDDVGQENYHWAIALVLLEADPELLHPRHTAIKAQLPAPLVEPFDERLRLHFSDWEGCWGELLQLGRDTLAEDTFTLDNERQSHRILRALASHGDSHGPFVLDMLRHQYGRNIRKVMEWLEPCIVKLAGWMRLEKAIPMIISRIDHEYDSVADETGGALSRIGTEAVIQAVARAWWRADVSARYSLCEPLEHIHCDLTVERCLAFFEKEADYEIATMLGHSLLNHFDTASIVLVSQFVRGDEDELDAELLDVRYKLIATCTIMGQTFPEYDAWYEEAQTTHWGWRTRTYGSLSKGYQGIFEELEA